MEVTGDSRQLFGETLTGARHVNLDIAGVNLVTVSAHIVAQGEGDCQAGFGDRRGSRDGSLADEKRLGELGEWTRFRRQSLALAAQR